MGPEARLYEYLMDNYNPKVRPILNASLPIFVNMTFYMNDLLDLVNPIIHC